MPVDPATVDLSRVQFAFTIGFHILFPTLTIGLSLFLVITETLWLRSGYPVYLALYKFWVRIFALSFGMGVVSGIVLSFQFGTNFAPFAYATGPVLGPLLSVEVLTAFFVEAGFLGIMIFGWEKVGRRLHLLATCLVCLGTINSAFWILAANSWMHTPAGTEFVDGQFVVINWLDVIFNPSFPYRLVHMLMASLLTTAFIVGGVSAYFVLRGEGAEFGRRGLSLAMWAALVLAPLQVFVGDLHGLQVQEDQPMKVAAMEGLWETRAEAPLLLFALPDQDAETNRFEVGIPGGASFILKHKTDGVVQGLEEVPPEERPNVSIVFWSFRVMVGAGLLMVLVAVTALILRGRRALYTNRVFLRMLVFCVPLGHVATLAGWFVAEVGRQPWTVYGLMRTADSVSTIPSAAVAASLTLFVVVYAMILCAYLFYVIRFIQRYDPHTDIVNPVQPEAMRGGAPRYVVPAE